MEHSVLLHNMQPEQLSALFANAAEEVLKKLLAESPQLSSNQKEDKLLSRKEACSLLHISLTTLHQKMKIGDLPFLRIGKRILLQESAVLRAITTPKRRRG